ncbi:MAG TPA: Spy/CpxP family protein refolding chaperone [Porticoccaceae bacterium]|nr:Spy/CpxP family protein refolding chaperone [Porticoccaceae bacterium]
MIKTPRILMATALITALSGATLALADHHGGGDGDRQFHGPKPYHQFHHGGPMHAERWLGRLGDKLALTEEQKADIKTIIDGGKDERKALKEAADKAREAEFNAIHGREGERTLRKLARASADARVDLMLHGFDTEKRIDKVLTDEQRAKLAEMKAERMARMQEHREKRQERMKEKMEQRQQSGDAAP